jgi:hypothetical protein
MAICIYSPRLDGLGNTVRGVKFAEELVERFNFHNYDSLVYSESCKMDPRRKSREAQQEQVVHLLFAAKSGDISAVKRLDGRSICKMQRRLQIHFDGCRRGAGRLRWSNCAARGRQRRSFESRSFSAETLEGDSRPQGPVCRALSCFVLIVCIIFPMGSNSTRRRSPFQSYRLCETARRCYSSANKCHTARKWQGKRLIILVSFHRQFHLSFKSFVICR